MASGRPTSTCVAAPARVCPEPAGPISRTSLDWGIKVPGYTTLVVSIMFFSGIQLLALGIMSAYVGRIYDEVKQRPIYLLKKRTGQGLPNPAVEPRP